VSPKISIILSRAFLQLWTKNNFAMAHWSLQSVVNSRPSPVDHTQHSSSYTVRWWLGVTQHVAQSIDISQNLFYLYHLFWELTYKSDPLVDFCVWLLRRCGLMQGCAILGFCWYSIPVRVSNHQKTSVLVCDHVNSCFQAKCLWARKKIKI